MNTTTTTAAAITVKIIANERGNPVGKLADAELLFSDGPLAGLKLIGFAIWGTPNRHRPVREGRGCRAHFAAAEALL